MWLYVALGIVGFFIANYLWSERKRKAQEAEAMEQRRKLEEAARRQREQSAALKQSGSSSGDGPRLVVCFGSQTGTAEEFAQVLVDEACDLGFAAELVDLEELEVDTLADERAAIFVMATYGEGEPTDNAKDFDEWLNGEDEQHDDGEFEELAYAVFGLGNKTYEHYCEMGNRTDRRLAELGAEGLVEVGTGDDDAGLEEDFDRWKKTLWAPFCAKFELDEPDSSAPKKIHRRLRMIEHKADYKPSDRSNLGHWRAEQDAEGSSAAAAAAAAASSSSSTRVYDVKTPYLAPIRVNRELHTEQSDRSCRHVEIEIGDALKYEAGDHLGIFAENDADVVERLLERLGADGDQMVSFVTIKESKRVLGPCTLRRAFTSYIDVSGLPRRSVLAGLVEYTADADEKARLERMGDPSCAEGTEDYHVLLRDNMSTILEILELFKSCAPPVDHVAELLPRLVPRYYSISSSPNAAPGFVHATAVVTRFTTPTGRVHNGVCTTWLQHKPAGYLVPVYTRQSEFRLPKDNETPIVMIGPGTGFAPFRGFLQERKARGASGPAMLFFGCRRRDTDYIYGDEMEQYLEGGVISALECAFSREQEEKVYVQHLLEKRGDDVWQALDSNGHVYICGDGKSMAKGVHNVLVRIVASHSDRTEEQAEQFLSDMRKAHRYQEDVW
jgi:NADPH-ferrihemoprotein reductase